MSRIAADATTAQHQTDEQEEAGRDRDALSAAEVGEIFREGFTATRRAEDQGHIHLREAKY